PVEASRPAANLRICSICGRSLAGRRPETGCSAESVGAFLDGARGTAPRHGWRPLLHHSPRTEVRGTAGPPRVKPARGGLLQSDTLPGLEHRFGLVMGPLTGEVLQKFGNVCGLDRF